MRISIITVCLNSEKTIEQTIQSVIRQEYDDLEYIVVDGQSKDKTLEIVETYADDISIIISEPDKGIYDAMNKGIALATGDIIGIINSDDWYEQGTFKEVQKCFQESGAEVVYGSLNMICEDKVIERWVPSDIEKIRYEMEIPHPTVFIKKYVYERYGAFCLEYKVAADYELILRLYTNSVRFVCLDRVLANYRHGGISEQQGRKCLGETLRIAQRYLTTVPLGKRESLNRIILHKFKAKYFEKALNEVSGSIWEVLHKRLGVHKEDNIVIFGAGNWGIKTYTELLQNSVQPLFFVDNNNEKWDESENPFKVLSPEKLKFYKGVLLVLVKNFVPEILLQIKKICNEEIYCITWEDIAVFLEYDNE